MNTEILKHEQFGNIRIQHVEGEPWFVAKDICDSLGLVNPSDRIKTLSDDERSMLNIGRASTGSLGMAWHVNESGLYQLIFQSRKPKAREFTRWVTSEVLPSIRKTGGYAITNAPMPRLESYGGELCISFGWLLAAGIAGNSAIKYHIRRGNTKKVRRASRGTPALLVYNTLPENYRKKIEATYGLPSMPAFHQYKYTNEQMLDLVGYVLSPNVKKTDIVNRLLKQES